MKSGSRNKSGTDKMDDKDESETKRPRVLKKNVKPKPFNPIMIIAVCKLAA